MGTVTRWRYGGSIPRPGNPFEKIRNPGRRRFKLFQIRWNEPMGLSECPYARRWSVNLGIFSIRLHRWYRSDDKRFFHDHPFWFWTFVLWGGYDDVGPDGVEPMTAGTLRFRPARHQHYVKVHPGGAWTLLITGPPTERWGFWVNGKLRRPLKFFHRYGHPPCEEL